MIDAHVHVWSLEPECYPWRQTLASVPVPTAAAPVEDLLEKMNDAGVDGAVLVQPSVYGWDNSYLCDCLERYPERFAGVCLVDCRAGDAAERLHYWCAERGCHGLQVNVIEDKDARWLLESTRDDLWRTALDLAVPVAFQIRPEQAGVLGQLARRLTHLTLIADYLGGSVFRNREHWNAFGKLAQHPNVYVKLLSVSQDSKEPYPFRDLWPFYEFLAATFPAERIMFGTDYPHTQQRCTYSRAITWLHDLPFLSEQAGFEIGAGTAHTLWSIPGHKED